MKYKIPLTILLVALGIAGTDPGHGQVIESVSLTLEEAVQIALERNEDLQLAQEDLKKSREQVREARADAFPKLDGSTVYDRNWLLPSIVFDTPEGRESFSVGTHNNITGTLSIRQKLYAGGKINAALGVANSFFDFSEAGATITRQRVVARVKLAFYDLLLAKDMVRVSILALDRARANLKQVESLRRAGRVSDYDILRAGVQVSDLRPDSIRAQNALKLAEVSLKNIAGIHHHVSIEAVGTYAETTTLDLDHPDSLVAYGLAHRPEIRQARAKIRMRERAIRVERAASRPSVDLTASGQLQVQSNGFDFSRDETRQSWATGLIITIPLFDGMRTRAKVAQAKVDRRRASIEAEQLERTIRLEIQQAWLDVKEAQERVSAQEHAVVQTARGVVIAQTRYASGAGTQLEVLDAQVVSTRAQAEYSQALRDRAVSIVNLEHRVGIDGIE